MFMKYYNPLLGKVKGSERKKRSLTLMNQAPKRNPASNYSPTVKYAVPSSLGPLSIVFGMGT